MRGQDIITGAVRRLGQVEILLVASKAVEQHLCWVRPGACGGIERAVHKFAALASFAPESIDATTVAH
jgi:hypothetical protein